MRPLFALIFLLLTTRGQTQDTSIIYIPAGKSFSEIAASKLYQFPQFRSGKVNFRNGNVTTAPLNYNFLNGQVEFITPKGDTLALIKDQAALVKNITIESSTYYYFNDGYLEVVKENENGKLLKRQQFKVVRRDKIGAYNQPSSTTAIESYSSYTFADGSISSSLTVREDITLKNTATYFLGDKYNTFLLANKKNIQRFYSKKKVEYDNYIRTHNVDFTNGDDIIHLFESL